LFFKFPGPALRDKWKNRRDNYTTRKNKIRKAKKSGAGAADIKRMKGKFYDMMGFLDPYLTGAE